MTSRSLTAHYGPGFTPKTVFDFQSEGRCCQTRITTQDYYLLNGTHKVCMCCAKNLQLPQESITFVKGDPNWVGDKDEPENLCLLIYRKGLERAEMLGWRFTDFSHVEVGVNITDQCGDDFAPAPKVQGPKSEAASSKGAHICILPNGCYFEFGFMLDPKSLYHNENYSFKLNSAKTLDGRQIRFQNSQGSKNIYVRGDSKIFINCFISGDESTRFYYVAPSKLETDNGIGPEQTGKSNIFMFEIEIYEKLSQPTLGVYRSAPTRGGASSQDTYRSAPTRGGQTRGGASGGTTYNQGATLTANGNSSYVNTTPSTNRYMIVHTTQITIQLMNNESEQTLVSDAKEIQQEVVTHLARVQERSEVLGVPMKPPGHQEQASTLF